MKKLSISILILSISLMLVGCSNNNKQVEQSDSTIQQVQEESSVLDIVEEDSNELEEVEEEPTPTAACLDGKYYSLGIEKLTLGSIAEDEVENLLLFENLKEITMTNMQCSPEVFEQMKELRPEIAFHYSFSLEKVGLPEIVVDEDTEELDVSNMEVTNVNAMKDYMLLLPKLTTLEMCDCGLSNEEMEILRDALPDTKVVWMLHMQEYSMRTDVIAYSTLVMWTPVPNPITSEDAEQFKYCTELRALDLGHQAITDLSWLEYLPELRLLILADNKVTDLTPIGTLKELRYVELFGNYGITTWEPLRNCTKMEELNIGFVAQPKDFSFLETMPNLKHFWAIGCVYTAAQDTQIRSLIPEGCDYCCIAKKPEDAQQPTGSGWRETIAFWRQYDMFRGNYLDEIFE